MSDDTPPAGGRPAFRAGQAFRELIEADPEARAAWERARTRIDAESLRETTDAIQAGLESALERLEAPRYFDPFESLELAESAECQPEDRPPEAPDLGIPGKAIGAAYALRREGKPVTVKAAAERAGVDRSHLTKRYPERAGSSGPSGRPSAGCLGGGRTATPGPSKPPTMTRIDPTPHTFSPHEESPRP